MCIRDSSWITYAFGALLVYSGLKLLRQGDAEVHPEKSPVLRLFRRVFPVTEEYVGGQFFTRRFLEKRDGLCATPLLLVLLVVETSDIVFAVDSIPAVLAITLNAFIVYTSVSYTHLDVYKRQMERRLQEKYGLTPA